MDGYSDRKKQTDIKIERERERMGKTEMTERKRVRERERRDEERGRETERSARRNNQVTIG